VRIRANLHSEDQVNVIVGTVALGAKNITGSTSIQSQVSNFQSFVLQARCHRFYQVFQGNFERRKISSAVDEDGLAQDTVKAINLVERKDLAVIFQLHIFSYDESS